MTSAYALLLFLLSAANALTNYSVWYDLDTNILSYTSGQWRLVPFNVPHSAHPYGEAILEVITTTKQPLGLKVPRVRTTEGQNHPLVYWSNSTANCVNFLECTQVWQILIVPHQCDFSGSYEVEWTTTCSSAEEIYMGSTSTCILEDHQDSQVGPYQITIDSTHLARCLTTDEVALSPSGPGLRACTDQYLATPTTDFPYDAMAYFQVTLESPGVAISVEIDHIWLDVNMPHVTGSAKLPETRHGDVWMDSLFQITRWRVMLCENQIRADETEQDGGEWLPIGCFHDLSKYYHAAFILGLEENIRSTDLSPAFQFQLHESIIPKGDYQAEVVVNVNLAITLKSGRRRLATVSSRLAPKHRRMLPQSNVQKRRRQNVDETEFASARTFNISGFAFEEAEDFASGQYMIFNNVGDTATEMVVVLGFVETELVTSQGIHMLLIGEDEVEVSVYAETLAAALEDKWPLDKGRITISALWACQEQTMCDLIHGAAPNEFWRPALSEEPVATIELTLIFHFVVSVGSPRAETVGVELQQMFLNADGDLYLLQPLHRAVPLRSYLADGTNQGPWAAPDPASQPINEGVLMIAVIATTATIFLCFAIVPRQLLKCLSPVGRNQGMRTAGAQPAQEYSLVKPGGPSGVGWTMTGFVGAAGVAMVGLGFISSYSRAVTKHQTWEFNTLFFNNIEKVACGVGTDLFLTAVFVATCGTLGCPNTGGVCLTFWLIFLGALTTAYTIYQDEDGVTEWFVVFMLVIALGLTLLGICLLACGAGKEPIKKAVKSMNKMTPGRNSRASKGAEASNFSIFGKSNQSEAGSKRSSRSNKMTSVGPRGEPSETGSNIIDGGRSRNRELLTDAWDSPRKGEPSAPPSTIGRAHSRAEGEERRSGFMSNWFKSKSNKSNTSLFGNTGRRINTNFAESKAGSWRDPKLASIGDMSVQSSGTRRIIRQEAPLDPTASANYQRTTRGFDADSDKSSTDRANLRGSGLSTWERRLKAREEIYGAKKKRSREKERRKSAKKAATSGREEKPDRSQRSNRQKHKSQSRNAQRQQRKESSGEESGGGPPDSRNQGDARSSSMRGVYVD